MAETETLIVDKDLMTLDLLIWRRFLRPTPGLVERALDLNPGLASLGLILPVGTKVIVEMPAAPDERVLPVITLWD